MFLTEFVLRWPMIRLSEYLGVVCLILKYRHSVCQRILRGKIHSCYYCLGQYVPPAQPTSCSPSVHPPSRPLLAPAQSLLGGERDVTANLLVFIMPYNLGQGFLKRGAEIGWNWTRLGDFDVFFCVVFDCYCQGLALS